MPFSSSGANNVAKANRFGVMPIGDSRTAGNGSTALGGYKRELFESLRNHLGHAPRFCGTDQAATCVLPNCAVSGLTSAQILTAVQAQSPLFPTCNVYLIDSGTNDVIAGTANSTITANILSTISQIYTDNPNATVIVANLYDRSGKSAEITAFNAALATAVAGHAKYSATPAIGKCFLYDQYSVIGPYGAGTLYGDVTHLNAAGYTIAAAGWYNQIITLY